MVEAMASGSTPVSRTTGTLIATPPVRNARGSAWPDPLRAALLAETAGADGITAHLREDRRHIRDADIEALMAAARA